MKMEKESVHCLEMLGLSHNQAKIYLSLISQEKRSAKEISITSGVSREEVYRNLKLLGKLGFVEKIFSYPNAYKASPLDSVISTMLKKKQLKYQIYKQKRINY